MDPRLRTALTMLVLVVVVIGAAAWGWNRLTDPIGEQASGPCTDTEVAAGDRVTTDQVVVTVLNAGTRAGLASRTMSDLVAQGFVEGQLANAPDRTDVSRVQIWTDNPRSPVVRLVRSHLGRVTVVRRDPVGRGVNVVVGNKFDELSNGRQRVPVRQDATLCLAGG